MKTRFKKNWQALEFLEMILYVIYVDICMLADVKHVFALVIENCRGNATW